MDVKGTEQIRQQYGKCSPSASSTFVPRVLLLPCSGVLGTRGPKADKWVQTVVGWEVCPRSRLEPALLLGFRGFRCVQPHSYNGKSKHYNSNNCFFQAAPSSYKYKKKKKPTKCGDFFPPEKSKSMRDLRKISRTGVLSIFAGLCQAAKLHESPSAMSQAEPSAADHKSRLLHPTPESEETLLSTGLVKLSTHCL